MFDELQSSVRADVVNAIYHLQMRQQAPPPPPPTEAAFASRKDPSAASSNGSNGAAARRAPRAGPAGQPARVAAAKVGRNELCPCGPGKKFKRCHGA
jgi:preprotein translocase subunit SecA